MTTFIEGFIIHESEDAYLLASEPSFHAHDPVWWPKSQVEGIDWNGELKAAATLEVSDWIAKKKGVA